MIFNLKRKYKFLQPIFTFALLLYFTTSCANIHNNSNQYKGKLLDKKVEITCVEFTKRSITLGEITQRSKRNYYETVISKIPVYRNSIVREDVWMENGDKIKYIPFVIDKNFEKRKYENPNDYYQKEVDGYVFLEMVFINKAGGIIFDNYYKATGSKRWASLPGAGCDLWIKDFNNETGLDAYQEFGIVVHKKKCIEEANRLYNQR